MCTAYRKSECNGDLQERWAHTDTEDAKQLPNERHQKGFYCFLLYQRLVEISDVRPAGCFLSSRDLSVGPTDQREGVSLSLRKI